MQTETFDFSGYNGITLPAMLWLPGVEIKAVLQITHGRNFCRRSWAVPF